MTDTQFYALEVQSIQPETDSAVCITFKVPEALAATFRFIQGQYLTLRHVIEGKEVRRSYSICSGVNDGTLKVGIKKIAGGAFSTFANDELKAGDTLEVMPPQGNFYTALEPSSRKNYMCLAVGSGITPMLSIIKTLLAEEPNSHVTLIYGNKNSATVMFKDDLGFLKNRYLARLNIIHVLSREEQDAEILFGRINNKKGAQLQNSGLIDIANTDEVFLCGPESMISEVSRGFRDFGMNETQLHYELFFASAEDAKAVVEKHHARAEKFAGQMANVTVKVDGRSVHFELSKVGENILDGALNNGADLPFSCKGGVCATCKCKVIEGQVEMDLNHSLSEKELAQGMVLSCQAHPISDRVLVDFDQK